MVEVTTGYRRLKGEDVFVIYSALYCVRVTGIRGLMRGMATLPQGKQELLAVKGKVGRPPGELGASPWNVIFFPSVI